jgi:sigma-B regulation protein RsbU (phosphoserine phosphatase)
MMGTDGIWETRSASNEFYGKDRIKAIIRKKRDATAEAISVALEADVRAFRGDADKLDDLTYVAIKIKPEPAPVGVPLATLMAAKA